MEGTCKSSDCNVRTSQKWEIFGEAVLFIALIVEKHILLLLYVCILCHRQIHSL